MHRWSFRHMQPHQDMCKGNNLQSLTLHFSSRNCIFCSWAKHICSEPTWLLHWPTIQVETWRQHVYPMPLLNLPASLVGSKAYTRVLLPQKTSRLSSNWQLCMPLSSYANSERSASAQGKAAQTRDCEDLPETHSRTAGATKHGTSHLLLLQAQTTFLNLYPNHGILLL